MTQQVLRQLSPPNHAGPFDSGAAFSDRLETYIIAATMNAPKLPIVESLRIYCRDHHVRRLSLFGSHAKGTANVDSDIDLLVEFEGGMEPGLIGLAEMESELSAMMGGRTVDLRTPRELSRHFRDEVLRDAVVQYAA
jgi:predicted nucleotidyltransferase